MNSSTSYTSAPLKLPSADAWGYLSTATTSAVVEHSGVSTTFSRLGTGRYGVTFSNSSPFSSGAYVVIATPEIADDTSLGPVMCRIANLSGSTALGRSAGFELNTFTYNSSQYPVLANSGVTVGFAAFSFSRDRSAYSPRLGNLIKWSEDFSNWTRGGGQGQNSVTVENSPNVYSPVGDYTAFLVTKRVNNPSDYYIHTLTGPIINSEKHYTASIHAKAGNTGGIRFVFGTLGSIVASTSAYDVRVDLNATAGSSNLSTRTGSVYSSTVLNSIVEGTSNVYDIGNGWRKIDITIKPISSSTGRELYLAVQPSPNPSGISGEGVYLWGAQITEGSIPVPYIKTEDTSPVYGSDAPRLSVVPGSSGYGITGATFGSTLTSLDSRRTATAYGTIVVPNRRMGGFSASAYLENCFNVVGVSTDKNTMSVFDVTFTKPMNNTKYAVILAGEYESDQNTSVTSGITSSNEFSDLLVRAGAGNKFKTINGFRVESLKQGSDNKWSTKATDFSPYEGRTERIHFMVFGGGTYGQP